MASTKPRKSRTSVFSVLQHYRPALIILLFFTLAANALNLIIPQLIATGINDFEKAQWNISRTAAVFALAVTLIFVFGFIQSLLQTKLSERVARDLRNSITARISEQSYLYIQKTDPNKLLTNLTSDVDAVKMFVAQALVSVISSLVIIAGASALLIRLNWKLGLSVMVIIPLIALSFSFIFKKVRTLFKKNQEITDRLNKIINENILASALVRILNAQHSEYCKFVDASGASRDLGMSILKLFALLIPAIVFISNMALLLVILMGGHFVISGHMPLGDFAAFYSYIGMLIFPVMVIGFMSNMIARASASYGRICEVTDATLTQPSGTLKQPLHGNIEVKHLSFSFGEKKVLKDINFQIEAGKKTAIIGPTAAGKTTLFNILAGLIPPQSGHVYYDGQELSSLDMQNFLKQVGIVFQDNVIFNTTIRNNIVFQGDYDEQAIDRAIQTAALDAFLKKLPDGMDTEISERGTSLSGGQKQRLMLARALAQHPQVLLLDDFTARVDNLTENNIWASIAQNYPGITLVSVMQKMNAVAHFDKIILIMEGELVATGTHRELLATSPEYNQLYEAQKSVGIDG